MRKRKRIEIDFKDTNVDASSQDVLNYIRDNGIIEFTQVQELIKMQKRKELLSKHPYDIWESTDGYWKTYLPDDTKSNGRRQIKRKSRGSLEDAIVEYWKAAFENPTIEEVFHEWNDRRLVLKKISPVTHQRNAQVFRRHFEEFGKRKIKFISQQDVEEFLETQIPEHNLTSKSFSNLKTVMRGLLKKAKKRDLIHFNVEEIFQNLDVSDKEFRKVVKEDNREVFDEEEFGMMLQYLVDHLDMENLGILLMFLTGIRVGELVALKHCDFDGCVFKVRRTETRIPKETGYEYRVKEFPKTEAGVRTVIIPEDYFWIVGRLHQCNPDGEFIFQKNDYRLTTNCIRRRMKRNCVKLGIVPKSPHKARKTYGSILLDHSIDNRLITDIMGHTDISCTENHYHRNRKSIESKVRIISSIPEFKVASY